MPYQVFLCKNNDVELDYFIKVATSAGYVPYELNRSIFIDIFTDGGLYRAPGAEFRPMRDGTYVFKQDGNRLEIVRM